MRIFLDEIIKFINSERNNKSSGNDAFQHNLINSFLINYLLPFQIFTNLVESLESWMLLIEHESSLPYIKKVIKTILQSTDPYTTILKNQLPKTSDAIISKNQAAAIKG